MPYDRVHYRLSETINVPRPLQTRPPILIGGGGEKKTLRLVAKYADACNLFAFGPEFVTDELDVLAAHCDTEGRDDDAIQKTILGGPDLLADTDAFLAEMERYAALGISHVQIAPAAHHPRGLRRGTRRSRHRTTR